MQISTAVLLAGFVLLVTGGGRTLSGLLNLRRGTIAALCLVIAAGSAFTIPMGAFRVNVGCAIVYALGIRACFAAKEKLFLLLTAGFAGLTGFLILRSAYNAAESGLLLATTSVLMLPLTAKFPREGAAAAMLAPLGYAIWWSIEEICLFERFALELGSKMQLDAAVCAVAGIAFLRSAWAFIRTVAGRTRRLRPTN